MLDFTDKITIFHIFINIAIMILVIYCSLKINPLKYYNYPIYYNNSSTSLSQIEEKIIYNQSLFFDNFILSNDSENNQTNTTGTGSHRDVHWPLFSMGFFSIFFICILIFSLLVKDKECNCDCCDCDSEISSSKSDNRNEACCCATCVCCTCCCRKRKCCDCGGGCSGTSCNNCNCNGAGEGIGYVILIFLLLFIFILFYCFTKSLGKSVSRVVALITLILFDCTFTVFGIIQGINEEMNLYSLLVIIFGIVGIINNLLGFICKYLYSKRGYVFSENLFGKN